MKIQDLEQEAGKLIVGRLPSTDLSKDFELLLRRGTIGGITLFKDNVSDLEQLAILISEVASNSHHIPIISVDQEGGAVQRFDDVLTPLPSPMAQAQAQSKIEDAIERVSSINAVQSSLLGINCLLSPVIDVASEKKCPIVCTRAFSNDSLLVAQYARMAAQAIFSRGVIAVGKHFPGHGATKEDSHHALAVVDDELTLWQERDLAPFIECLSDLPAILTGHIWVKSIEDKPLPASLSYAINQKLLRENLGFEGLILTDDMTMKGITSLFGLGEACVMAIAAGADIVLVNGTLQEQLEAHSAIVEAFSSGRLPIERLNQSIQRRDRLFNRRPETAHPYKNREQFADLLASIENENDSVLEIASAALSVLKADFASSVEISNCESKIDWLVLTPKHERYPLDLVLELNKLGCTGYTKVEYSLNPDSAEIDSLAKECRGKNVVLLTFRAQINAGQVELAKAVAKTADIKLAVMCDIPFDLELLPDWPCVVATYDPSNLAMQALAQFIKSKDSAQTRSQIESRSI